MQWCILKQRTKSSKHRTFLRIKRSSNFPFDGLFRTFEMRFSQNFRLLKPKHHARFAEYHFNRTKYQMRWNNTRIKKALINQSFKWRKRWDSNPRNPCGFNGFQDRPDQPLRHSSVSCFNIHYNKLKNFLCKPLINNFLLIIKKSEFFAEMSRNI